MAQGDSVPISLDSKNWLERRLIIVPERLTNSPLDAQCVGKAGGAMMCLVVEQRQE